MKLNKKGIFNIGSGNKINLNEIVKIVQKKKQNLENPRKNIFADISKLVNLNWKPKYKIIDILNEYKKNK